MGAKKTRAAAQDLRRIAANDQSLVHVHWRNDGLGPEVFRQLASALRGNTYVKTLDLSLVNPGVTDETLGLLADAIPCSTIELVVFFYEEFKQQNLQAFGPTYSLEAAHAVGREALLNWIANTVARNDPSVTVVEWGDAWDVTGVDDVTVGALARALRYNTHILTLDLTNELNRISGRSLEQLEAVVRFPDCNVHDVVVLYEHTEEDVEAAQKLQSTCMDKFLSRIAADHPSVTSVKWFTRADDTLVGRLADALHGNSHVESIDIRWSDVTDVGLTCLAKALPQCAAFQVSLGLQDDDAPATWSKECIEAVFAACLPQLTVRVQNDDPKLVDIDWRFYQGAVNTDSVAQLAAALRTNTHVRRINLSDSPALTNEDCALLEDVVCGEMTAVGEVYLKKVDRSGRIDESVANESQLTMTMVGCDGLRRNYVSGPFSSTYQCNESMLEGCQRNIAADFSRSVYRPLQRLLLACLGQWVSHDLLDEIAVRLAASRVRPCDSVGNSTLPLSTDGLVNHNGSHNLFSHYYGDTETAEYVAADAEMLAAAMQDFTWHQVDIIAFSGDDDVSTHAKRQRLFCEN